jgi:hypothetical protein
MILKTCAVIGVVALCTNGLLVSSARAQQAGAMPSSADPVHQRLQNLQESLRFAEESLARKLDEQMLFQRLQDIAEVDKVRFTGPPPRVIKNPTGQGAGNPVILTAFTFLPKKLPEGTKLPLIVFVHGGVHGNFDST